VIKRRICASARSSDPLIQPVANGHAAFVRDHEEVWQVAV